MTEGLPDDWSYQLGQAFLDAAVSCLPEGVSCERRFVTYTTMVEGPPPECPCQLVAIVTEGLEPDGTTSHCGTRRTATVRLVLDLCGPAAGAPNEVPDPVKWATMAREHAAIRWRMMLGLEDWRRTGRLCPPEPGGWPAGTDVSCCRRFTPGPWRPGRNDWGSARWEAMWVWSER